jgi:hypothetical protein
MFLSMTKILVSYRVSRRLMHTLPHSACSLPIPPSRTSVPCSLPRLLWLTATLAFEFPSADAFIQHFVKDKCQAIMEEVDKLDNMQDGFIHYQLIRFCQATRLHYLNGHVQLANQNVLQQHVNAEEGHPGCLQHVAPAGPRLG